MKLKPLLEYGYDDYDEEDEMEEHFSLKHAEKETFKRRTILVTDLYDGDVYGILDGPNGSRFMVSTPIWRDETGPGEVTDDEIEVADFDHSLSPKDIALLKAWTIKNMS